MCNRIVVLLLVLPIFAQATSLRIAVATNFYPVLKQLKPDFEQKHQVTLDLVSGSSGVFYAQIANGAPFDVMLSADKKRPASLVALGKGDTNSLKRYATGTLVWWQPHQETQGAVTMEDLLAYRGKLAIANPKFAPYGQAAMAVLAHNRLEANISLVYGSNVARVFQYIDSGNVRAGFVAQSYLINSWLKTENEKYRRYVEVPTAWYPKIAQYGVVITQTKHRQLANDFVNYMTTEPVQARLRTFGYQ